MLRNNDATRYIKIKFQPSLIGVSCHLCFTWENIWAAASVCSPNNLYVSSGQSCGPTVIFVLPVENVTQHPLVYQTFIRKMSLEIREGGSNQIYGGLAA